MLAYRRNKKGQHQGMVNRLDAGPRIGAQKKASAEAENPDAGLVDYSASGDDTE